MNNKNNSKSCVTSSTGNKIVVTFLISAFISGCASMKAQPKIQNKVISADSVISIESSEGVEVAYVHTGKSGEIFCNSAGHDFAFASSGGLSLSGSDAGKTAGIGESTSAGIAELGGINSGVLIVREIFYRNCEFMANLKAINGLTADNAMSLFQDSMKAILQVSSDYASSSETGQATINVTTGTSSNTQNP